MEGVEECSKLLINFNPKDNLIIHEIFVIRNNEIVDKLCSAEIQVLRRESQAERNILSGDLTLSIILNDIKINDFIVVSYSSIFLNKFTVSYFNKLISLEYGVPIHKLHLAVIFDKRKPVEYKFLTQQENIEWRESQESNVLIINKVDIPAKSSLKYEPYWYWKLSLLQIGIKATWNELASSYTQYFLCPEIKEPILLKFVEELSASCQDSQAIILAVLNYINKNIRYFSNYNPIDFIKPADPNLTVQRAYGDCKDLVFLFNTILTYLNIKSYPVLVNSTWGKI